MAARKRTDQELARDRPVVAHLYCTGMSQYDVAIELNKRHYKAGYITNVNVSADWQWCIKWWRKTLESEVGAMKANELAKIDAIETEAWDAWRSSKTARRVNKVKKDASGAERTVTVEERSGNPRFLERVGWCVGKRCEILGLNAPLEVDSRILSIAEIAAEVFGGNNGE